MNKLGINRWNWVPGLSDACCGLPTKAAELGFTAVELPMTQTQLSPALRDEVRACGLEVSLCAAMGAGRDLSSFDADVRASTMDYLTDCLKTGAEVGAVMLAFFDWRVFVIAFGLFILAVVLTKWISLGSILGAISFPITTWAFYHDPVLTAMAFGMAAAVVFMHRSNIGRILHGTENKFSFKSKKTIEAASDGEEK